MTIMFSQAIAVIVFCLVALVLTGWLRIVVTFDNEEDRKQADTIFDEIKRLLRNTQIGVAVLFILAFIGYLLYWKP